MKRSFVVLGFIALFSSSAAADKATWRNVAIGSGVFTILSGSFSYYEWDKMEGIERELCDGGIEVPQHCAASPMPQLTYSQVDELNREGDQHQMLSTVGLAGAAVGVGVTAFALYKFITTEDDKAEPAVVVAPVVTREGGGATVQLRF